MTTSPLEVAKAKLGAVQHIRLMVERDIARRDPESLTAEACAAALVSIAESLEVISSNLNVIAHRA